MNRIVLLLVVLLILNNVSAQDKGKLSGIQVSENGHFLVNEKKQPFFWLGDTAWELFHRLTKEEILKYLDNRQKKGFNVIQAVILAEFDGLTKPNRYNEIPLYQNDPLKPNEKYFELVDYTVKMALSRNIYLGLLPTWGDKVTKLWGVGPVIFNPSNAYQYGLWLGKRYKDYPNIIWILGGDRPPVTDSADFRPVWRAMAKGIIEGTNNKALISYHIAGGEKSTSHYIHNEDWLDVNMMQSGHGSGHDVPVWDYITRDWNLSPTKPVLDAEPNYEDHPVNPWPKWDPKNGYFRDYDVRKQTYRSVFAGGCGVTYGHHSVWQFWSPREEKINYADRYWTEALDRPGAFQVGYLRKLIESRPQLTRIPDQSLILEGQGEKGEYICVTRDQTSSYIMIYIPFGKKIVVNTAEIKSDNLNLHWFDPKKGKVVKSWKSPNQKRMAFETPTQGFGNDWVLIIDNANIYSSGL
jgi:hypothetical protein